MSRPQRPTGPRGAYPTCPTHELLMHELALAAQEQTRILTQWELRAGREARRIAAQLPDPIPRLGLGLE